MIRHCVEESNVDDNIEVMDATKIRHVTIVGGRIESMSGFIDPASHLNLDYPDHRVNICTIAEKLEVGAKVRMDSDGLVLQQCQGKHTAITGLSIIQRGS